jgi:hypothetical protein
MPSGRNAPSLMDIAVSLSRVPRFGGHTLRPWSVAEHTLACELMGQLRAYGTLILGHLLLHDAHEAILGDIPSTWCTDEIKMLKEELDVRIYESLDWPEPDVEEQVLIKNIDHAAVLAEAQILGPPGCSAWFGESPPEWALEAVLKTEEFVFPRSQERVAALLYDQFCKLIRGEV